MNDTLSIILPIHDAQATLSLEVEALLDVVPELTARFDLLIIDDGSQDGSEELARELAARYAQVHVARHAMQLGLNESIHTALCQTDSDYLLLRSSSHPLRADSLPRLWASRGESSGDTDSSVGQGSEAVDMPTRIGWLDRLMKWGQAVREAHAEGQLDSGCRLMRREALAAAQLRNRPSGSSYIEHLRQTSTQRQPAATAPKHVVPAPKGAPSPMLPGQAVTSNVLHTR